MTKNPDPSCWKAYDETLSCDAFLRYVKPYKHIRVGTLCGKEGKGKIYFRVTKKEICEIVRIQEMDVTFDVMVNPYVKGDMGTMFIKKMRCALFDKK